MMLRFCTPAVKALLALALLFPCAAQSGGDARVLKVPSGQQAILAVAAPNWNVMCDLVDAIAIEARRPAFLKEHRYLSNRFASVEQFSDAVDKWKGRVWSLPRDIRKVDGDRLSVQCMESRTGDSVVVTLKERGSDRLVRIKGIFAGGELLDISILAGSMVQAGAKGGSGGKR